LILDEPTSGLDPVLQDTFRELVIERKAQGTTVWLTSHVMSDVDRVADRVGLIDQGKLAQELTMDELRNQSSGNIDLTFPSPQDASAFDGVPGVSNVVAQGNALSFHVDGPVTALLARAAELGATGIRTKEHDLEDIFLSTYSNEEGR